MNQRLHVLVLTCLGLMPVSRTIADTVSIVADRDNTLYEYPWDDLSNGAGTYMFGGVNGDGMRRRAVFRFNVAASVPAGSTITAVSLRLNMSKTTAPAVDMTLHRLTTNWGEGTSNAAANEGAGAPATPNDATWFYNFYNSSQWTNPGGDFSPTISASRNIAGVGLYTWSSTAQLVADVQGWLDNPPTNYGWLLKAAEEFTVHTAKRFDTREHATPGNRPTLTITYSPAVAPVINTIPNEAAVCGQPYTSPAPTLSQGSPAPTWTLLAAPPGMTINAANGVVTWPLPIPSATPYTVTRQATNSAGSDTESTQLTILPGDFNGDGLHDTADLSPFVDHLLDVSAAQACAADVDMNGDIDGRDIQAFVTYLP